MVRRRRWTRWMHARLTSAILAAALTPGLGVPAAFAFGEQGHLRPIPAAATGGPARWAKQLLNDTIGLKGYKFSMRVFEQPGAIVVKRRHMETDPSLPLGIEDLLVQGAAYLRLRKSRPELFSAGENEALQQALAREIETVRELPPNEYVLVLQQAARDLPVKVIWQDEGAASVEAARASLLSESRRIHDFTTTLEPGEENIIRLDPAWFAAVVYGTDNAAIHPQLAAAGLGRAPTGSVRRPATAQYVVQAGEMRTIGQLAVAEFPEFVEAASGRPRRGYLILRSRPGADEDASDYPDAPRLGEVPAENEIIMMVPAMPGGAGNFTPEALARARGLLAQAGFEPSRIDRLILALDTLNPFIFRKYDIRGNARDVARPDLTPEAAFWIGWGYASLLQPGATFVLGRDMRPTGPALAEAIIEGASLAGVNVEYADVIGTGMMKWSYLHDQFISQRSGGGHAVTISGSHSPLQVHGVKLGKGGRPFVDEQIQELLKTIQEGRLVLAPPGQLGARTDRDITADYAAAVRTEMRRLLGSRTLSGLRIAYGYTPGMTTRPEVPIDLLREFGAEVRPFEMQRQLVDPNEPHTAQELADEVRRLNAAVPAGERPWFGLFNDPDTDRAGMVNERGEVVSGDDLLVLAINDTFARYPAEKRVVLDSRHSSLRSRRIAVALGGEIVLSAGGYANIIPLMEERRAHLGGERTAHFMRDYVVPYMGLDDGFMNNLYLASIVANEGRLPGALLDDLERRYDLPEVFYRELGVAVPDTIKWEVAERLSQDWMGRFSGNPDVQVETVDGILVFDRRDGSTRHVRVSNTGAKLTVPLEIRLENASSFAQIARRIEADIHAAARALRDEGVVEFQDAQLGHDPHIDEYQAAALAELAVAAPQPAPAAPSIRPATGISGGSGPVPDAPIDADLLVPAGPWTAVGSLIGQTGTQNGGGYLRSALTYLLVSEGFAVRRGEPGSDRMEIALTERGRIALEMGRDAYTTLLPYVAIAPRIEEYLFPGSRSPPPSQDELDHALAVVQSLVDRAKREWDIPHETDPARNRVRAQVLSHLNGELIGTIWPRLRRHNAFGDPVTDLTQLAGANLPLLQSFFDLASDFRWTQWTDATRTVFVLTETGRIAAERYGFVTGVTASYRSAARLSTLFFGTPGEIDAVFGRDAQGSELAVDRDFNVEVTNFNHTAYDPAVNRILRAMFDERNVQSPPTKIMDTGAGGGERLAAMFRFIATETPRGQRLNEEPITLIAVDLNTEVFQRARATIRGTLEELERLGIIRDAADYFRRHVIVLQGDISRPWAIAGELLSRYHIFITHRTLHVNSALVHNAPHRPATPLEQAELAAWRASSPGAYTQRGRPLSNADVEHNRFQLYREWSGEIAPDGRTIREGFLDEAHGNFMLMVELYLADPQDVARRLGSSQHTAYAASHLLFSDQYPVDPDTDGRLIGQVGAKILHEEFFPADSPAMGVRLIRVPGPNPAPFTVEPPPKRDRAGRDAREARVRNEMFAYNRGVGFAPVMTALLERSVIFDVLSGQETGPAAAMSGAADGPMAPIRLIISGRMSLGEALNRDKTPEDDNRLRLLGRIWDTIYQGVPAFGTHPYLAVERDGVFLSVQLDGGRLLTAEDEKQGKADEDLPLERGDQIVLMPDGSWIDADRAGADAGDNPDDPFHWDVRPGDGPPLLHTDAISRRTWLLGAGAGLLALMGIGVRTSELELERMVEDLPLSQRETQAGHLVKELRDLHGAILSDARSDSARYQAIGRLIRSAAAIARRLSDRPPVLDDAAFERLQQAFPESMNRQVLSAPELDWRQPGPLADHVAQMVKTAVALRKSAARELEASKEYQRLKAVRDHHVLPVWGGAIGMAGVLILALKVYADIQEVRTSAPANGRQQLPPGGRAGEQGAVSAQTLMWAGVALSIVGMASLLYGVQGPVTAGYLAWLAGGLGALAGTVWLFTRARRDGQMTLGDLIYRWGPGRDASQGAQTGAGAGAAILTGVERLPAWGWGLSTGAIVGGLLFALGHFTLQSAIGGLAGGLLVSGMFYKIMAELKRSEVVRERPGTGRLPVLAVRVPFLQASARMPLADAERWLATQLEEGHPLRLRLIEDEVDLSAPRYVVIERRGGVAGLPVAERARTRAHLYLSPEGETALVVAPETEVFAGYRPPRVVTADDLIPDAASIRDFDGADELGGPPADPLQQRAQAQPETTSTGSESDTDALVRRMAEIMLADAFVDFTVEWVDSPGIEVAYQTRKVRMPGSPELLSVRAARGTGLDDIIRAIAEDEVRWNDSSWGFTTEDTVDLVRRAARAARDERAAGQDATTREYDGADELGGLPADGGAGTRMADPLVRIVDYYSGITHEIVERIMEDTPPGGAVALTRKLIDTPLSDGKTIDLGGLVQMTGLVPWGYGKPGYTAFIRPQGVGAAPNTGDSSDVETAADDAEKHARYYDPERGYLSRPRHPIRHTLSAYSIPTPRTERELAWLLSWAWKLDQPYDTLDLAIANLDKGREPLSIHLATFSAKIRQAFERGELTIHKDPQSLNRLLSRFGIYIGLMGASDADDPAALTRRLVEVFDGLVGTMYNYSNAGQPSITFTARSGGGEIEIVGFNDPKLNMSLTEFLRLAAAIGLPVEPRNSGRNGRTKTVLVVDAPLYQQLVERALPWEEFEMDWFLNPQGSGTFRSTDQAFTLSGLPNVDQLRVREAILNSLMRDTGSTTLRDAGVAAWSFRHVDATAAPAGGGPAARQAAEAILRDYEADVSGMERATVRAAVLQRLTALGVPHVLTKLYLAQPAPTIIRGGGEPVPETAPPAADPVWDRFDQTILRSGLPVRIISRKAGAVHVTNNLRSGGMLVVTVPEGTPRNTQMAVEIARQVVAFGAKNVDAHILKAFESFVDGAAPAVGSAGADAFELVGGRKPWQFDVLPGDGPPEPPASEVDLLPIAVVQPPAHVGPAPVTYSAGAAAFAGAVETAAGSGRLPPALADRVHVEAAAGLVVVEPLEAPLDEGVANFVRSYAEAARSN